MNTFFTAVGVLTCTFLGVAVYVYVACAVSERIEKDWKAGKIRDMT